MWTAIVTALKKSVWLPFVLKPICFLPSRLIRNRLVSDSYSGACLTHVLDETMAVETEVLLESADELRGWSVESSVDNGGMSSS